MYAGLSSTSTVGYSSSTAEPSASADAKASTPSPKTPRRRLRRMTSGIATTSSSKKGVQVQKKIATAKCAAKAKARAKAKAKQPASKAAPKPKSKAVKGKPPVQPKEEPEDPPKKEQVAKAPKVTRTKSEVETAEAAKDVRECLKRGKTSDIDAKAAPAHEHEDATSEDSEAVLARKLKKQREAHAAYMRFSRSLKSRGLTIDSRNSPEVVRRKSAKLLEWPNTVRSSGFEIAARAPSWV